MTFLESIEELVTRVHALARFSDIEEDRVEVIVKLHVPVREELLPHNSSLPMAIVVKGRWRWKIYPCLPARIVAPSATEPALIAQSGDAN